MGKAFARLYYHFVWTTKNRSPVTTKEVKAHLFKSIGRKCRDLGADIRALNAVEDHVHLLTKLPPTLAPTQFIRQVKGIASYIVNRSGSDNMLCWQRGYGVLTLSSSQLRRVVAYIENQEEHHSSGDVMPSLETVEESDDG